MCQFRPPLEGEETRACSRFKVEIEKDMGLNFHPGTFSIYFGSPLFCSFRSILKIISCVIWDDNLPDIGRSKARYKLLFRTHRTSFRCNNVLSTLFYIFNTPCITLPIEYVVGIVCS
jgi:hypothetical protein